MRSAIQATDSTCTGCTAKSAATAAQRQNEPVSARSARKSSSVPVACSPRLTRWWAPAFRPKKLASAMCESQVRGCQLAAWKPVNAHFRPFQPSPPCTIRFCVT